MEGRHEDIDKERTTDRRTEQSTRLKKRRARRTEEMTDNEQTQTERKK